MVGVAVEVVYMKTAILILALSGWLAFGLQTNHIQVSGNDFKLKAPMSCYTGVSTAVYPWDQIKQERKK